MDEKDLVNKLDKALRCEFSTDIAFRELSAGYGIADLVLAPKFSFRNAIEAHLYEPITNFGCLNLFLILDCRKTYTMDAIMRLFPSMSSRTLRRHLRFLVHENYLQESGGVFVKTSNRAHLSPIKRIVAIEVKLRDYRSGLIQARRYKYFADESYLAMPAGAAHLVKLPELQENGIGLILFDDSDGSIQVTRPRRANRTRNINLNQFAKEIMTVNALRSTSAAQL